jgi:hypothetical protein
MAGLEALIPNRQKGDFMSTEPKHTPGPLSPLEAELLEALSACSDDLVRMLRNALPPKHAHLVDQHPTVVAARAALAGRSTLERASDAVDAKRWRTFVAICMDTAEQSDAPDVSIEFQPSGYNGSDWNYADLCWRSPKWKRQTAADMNAAIDAAMGVGLPDPSLDASGADHNAPTK